MLFHHDITITPCTLTVELLGRGWEEGDTVLDYDITPMVSNNNIITAIQCMTCHVCSGFSPRTQSMVCRAVRA